MRILHKFSHASDTLTTLIQHGNPVSWMSLRKSKITKSNEPI